MTSKLGSWRILWWAIPLLIVSSALAQSQEKAGLFRDWSQALADARQGFDSKVIQTLREELTNAEVCCTNTRTHGRVYGRTPTESPLAVNAQ